MINVTGENQGHGQVQEGQRGHAYCKSAYAGRAERQPERRTIVPNQGTSNNPCQTRDKTETYPRIPINSSIAEFPDKGVILSETRDGIVNEINVIRNASQTAIDQVDLHRRIIASCDQLLLDLNPQLKHEQEQAGKIARLEEQLAGMSDQIAALTGMLSKSLGKKKED